MTNKTITACIDEKENLIDKLEKNNIESEIVILDDLENLDFMLSFGKIKISS